MFRNAGPPKEGKTYTPENYDLRLKPNTKCPDAGGAIRQVTDHITGSAPDLGCYEHGQAPPRYGPRPK